MLPDMVPEYSNTESELSVGVIGASGWAEVSHLPAIVGSPGLRLAAVATTRDESARAAAERWGARRWFSSPVDLAADPSVDIVTVSVKAPLHLAVIEEILGSGKPILCERPMGTSTQESERIAELIAASGSRGFVGLQASVDPVLTEVGRLVAGGTLGTVLSATVRASRASKDPVPAKSVYTLDAASGAGTLEILGGHTLSALFAALGRETLPTPAPAVGRTTLIHREHTSTDGAAIEASTPDVITGLLDLGPGLAAVTLTDGDIDPGTEITIIGTQGRAVLRTVPCAELRLRQPQMAEWSAEITSPEGIQKIEPEPSQLPLAARNPSRLYQAIRQDLRNDTQHSPQPTDAARIHQILDRFNGRGA